MSWGVVEERERPLLVITRGLPASGKSTWAKEWVARDEENRARVNRDDIRFMICGRYWPAPEDTVTVAEKAMIRALIGAGRSVVVDATHLRMQHAREIQKLAAELGADFDCVDFPTDVSECITRDIERERRGERAVGSEVIMNMALKFGLHKKWLPPVPELEDDVQPSYRYVANTTDGRPWVWMVDIDGTIAHMDGRGPFEWHRVGEDNVDTDLQMLLWHLMDGEAKIVFLSGRDESCRAQTEAWLREHELEQYEDLFMRPEGDNRKDSIVKLELFQKHVAPYYNVHAVLDDRQQVVDMWRRIGLKCYQVAEGNF